MSLLVTTSQWQVLQIGLRDPGNQQRSYPIALKQGNQNPQNNMIASFSFASTAYVTQWSNYLTQRAEIFTLRSNLTPQRAKNTVNDLRIWYQSPFRHIKASWLHTFLSFLLETSKLQSAVYSEWKQFCRTLHCCWIHWEKTVSWSRTWSISLHLHLRIGKIDHIIEHPNT